MLCCAREDLVEQDDADTDECTGQDQAPIDIFGDDALSQGGNQPRLRCGQRTCARFRPRRADESVGVINEIEDRRNYESSRNDADDERYLLLPRRRVNQLAGFEILQVVIRNCRNVEDDGGGKKCERHKCLMRVRRHVRFYADHQQ